MVALGLSNFWRSQGTMCTVPFSSCLAQWWRLLWWSTAFLPVPNLWLPWFAQCVFYLHWFWIVLGWCRLGVDFLCSCELFLCGFDWSQDHSRLHYSCSRSTLPFHVPFDFITAMFFHCVGDSCGRWWICSTLYWYGCISTRLYLIRGILISFSLSCMSVSSSFAAVGTCWCKLCCSAERGMLLALVCKFIPR